jgi:paraquat-inducible protein A
MTAPPIVLLHERECQDCGLFQTLPALEPQAVALCCRCNATLRHGRHDSINRALACTIGAFALFLVSLQLPFMDVSAVGTTYDATLFTGPDMLGQRGMWEISTVVLFTLVAMPAVQLMLLLYVLAGLRLPALPPFSRGAFGFVERVRPWAMVEVFLLGVFVAYTRLQAIAEVTIGPGLIALAGVMLCVIMADVVLDHEAVWEELEERGSLAVRAPPEVEKPIGCDCCHLVVFAPPLWPCPRCGRKLRNRKRQSIIRTWALLGAAALLYLPANFYPILTVERFGQGEPSTIMSGVLELIDNQMFPLAMLVFMASIVVPMVKLASLLTLLLTTHSGSVTRLRDRTRLYRFIDSIGRWSMIDVFMLTTLVALVHMGLIATVLPGGGAIAFASVVVLTMLASISFDPRLMWDAAQAAGHDLDAEDLENALPERAHA